MATPGPNCLPALRSADSCSGDQPSSSPGRRVPPLLAGGFLALRGLAFTVVSASCAIAIMGRHKLAAPASARTNAPARAITKKFADIKAPLNRSTGILAAHSHRAQQSRKCGQDGSATLLARNDRPEKAQIEYAASVAAENHTGNPACQQRHHYRRQTVEK